MSWSYVYHRVEIEGRMSSMERGTQKRSDLLQGTLDMLILRTLLYGPAHGHQIGKHIQRTTNDFLQMQHGSLYPRYTGWSEGDGSFPNGK
jgi:hypothetical protein